MESGLKFILFSGHFAEEIYQFEINFLDSVQQVNKNLNLSILSHIYGRMSSTMKQDQRERFFLICTTIFLYISAVFYCFSPSVGEEFMFL